MTQSTKTRALLAILVIAVLLFGVIGHQGPEYSPAVASLLLLLVLSSVSIAHYTARGAPQFSACYRPSAPDRAPPLQ